MKVSNAVCRAKLVDEPIVEMILAHKFYDKGLKFIKADLQSDYDGTDIICYANGFKRNLNVKRNSSKYFNSPNFTITINKNKVDSYKNTLFIFIDEVADCLYMISGEKIYKYIIDNRSRMLPSHSGKEWMFYLLIPKKELASFVDNENGIIKYNKSIASILERGRDESLYTDLI